MLHLNKNNVDCVIMRQSTLWSMNDSNAIITMMWNGILSIDDIYGLEVEKTTLDFNSEE